MVTPLQADLRIDLPKLALHAQALLAQGCGGVTLFGTTGEDPPSLWKNASRPCCL